MVRSLSMDLRSRVIQAVNEGASRREAAARFGVSAASAATVARAMPRRRRWREWGARGMGFSCGPEAGPEGCAAGVGGYR